MTTFLLVTAVLIASVSADSISDKIDAILVGASSTCSNKYFSSPYLQNVLCDNLIPQKYLEKIGLRNLTFGPDSIWCGALGCAYRLMGCHEQTFRIEAEIIKATGSAEDCGDKIGLGDDDCQSFSRFIADAPPAQKRSLPADEQQEKHFQPMVFENLTPEQRADALVGANEVLQHFAPEVYNTHFQQIHDMFPEIARKRDSTLDLLLDQLHLCSELIYIGLKAIEGEVNLPLNVSEHLGPCGTLCEVGLCALNVMCASHALPLITRVNSLRSGRCDELHCAKFVPGSESKCKGVTCDTPVGTFTRETCPPPKTIYQPSMTSADDCCEKCEDKCDGQSCPTLSCDPPVFPLCTTIQQSKYDEFACCKQCIDPCETQRAGCGAQPTEAECRAKGLFLAPSRPGDCCLSCQPTKCAGMDCRDAPKTAQECAAQGLQLADAAEDPQNCSECCRRCVSVSGNTKDIKVLSEGSATTQFLAMFAAAASLFALFI